MKSPYHPVKSTKVLSLEFPSLEFKESPPSGIVSAQRTLVLNDINLQIKEGEFVAIVGFRSGKSTLISLIAAFMRNIGERGGPQRLPAGPTPGRGSRC